MQRLEVWLPAMVPSVLVLGGGTYEFFQLHEGSRPAQNLSTARTPLRDVSLGAIMYSTDHDDRIWPARDWERIADR